MDLLELALRRNPPHATPQWEDPAAQIILRRLLCRRPVAAIKFEEDGVEEPVAVPKGLVPMGDRNQRLPGPPRQPLVRLLRAGTSQLQTLEKEEARHRHRRPVKAEGYGDPRKGRMTPLERCRICLVLVWGTKPRMLLL